MDDQTGDVRGAGKSKRVSAEVKRLLFIVPHFSISNKTFDLFSFSRLFRVSATDIMKHQMRCVRPVMCRK